MEGLNPKAEKSENDFKYKHTNNMKLNTILITFLFTALYSVNAQEPINHTVFEKQPINFGGEKSTDPEAVSLMSGRLAYKKVTVPTFPHGTDVKIKLTVRSNGDRWDKSGSCFVVSDPEKLSILSTSS